MTKALGTVLILGCACLHGYDAASEAGQADKAYRRAMNAGDDIALERLTTKDFLFIRRTGEIWDKPSFLRYFKGRKVDVEEKDLKTRIYGDTAILTHIDFIKTAEGAMVEMIATRVFVKQRGSWKLASVQDTALAAR